ncbi:unnamed protein product [Pleuronectes platessa]|uniref:Uncharacterized protein n=1 Tax=Pleuronectes platessa TaxID=8262 RepID=A0A9N7YKB9_PLEPL|nr:unnamed protein product [Pleuronectes platessa]
MEEAREELQLRNQLQTPRGRLVGDSGKMVRVPPPTMGWVVLWRRHEEPRESVQKSPSLRIIPPSLLLANVAHQRLSSRTQTLMMLMEEEALCSCNNNTTTNT